MKAELIFVSVLLFAVVGGIAWVYMHESERFDLLHELTDVRVTNKEYVPERTWVQMVQSGKVLVPITHDDPERWRIWIAGVVDGDSVQTYVHVSKATYDRAHIGSHFEGNVAEMEITP